MKLKIILLLCIFVFLNSLEIKAMKRIKRNSNLKAHTNSIKHDIVMIQGETYKPIEILNKSNLKAANYDTYMHSDAKHNSSHKLPTDADKTRNTSSPLALILRENQRKLNERERQDRMIIDKGTVDVSSKNLENNVNKLETFMDRQSDMSRKPKHSFKYYKTKNFPHLLHSTDNTEAKVALPPHHIQPGYGDLSSFPTIEQLIRVGNMMLFNVGMDSLPYNDYYTNTHITQNSPSAFKKDYSYQPSNEPVMDYIFNSIERSQPNNFHPKTIKLSSSPFIEDGGLSAHSTIYEPSVSVKEPTQLSTIMQTALDTLLGSDDVDGGDKNENEIDFRCPIHNENKRLQNVDHNADIMQVCSCRFIKAPKEEHKKKLIYFL